MNKWEKLDLICKHIEKMSFNQIKELLKNDDKLNDYFFKNFKDLKDDNFLRLYFKNKLISRKKAFN